MKSEYMRWRRLAEESHRKVPKDEPDEPDVAEGHDPLCVWEGEKFMDPCLGCDLVSMRFDACHDPGELGVAARAALNELSGLLLGYIEDVSSHES